MQNFFSDLFKSNVAPRLGCGDIALEACAGCSVNCEMTCIEHCSENCETNSGSGICTHCDGSCSRTCVGSCSDICKNYLVLK